MGKRVDVAYESAACEHGESCRACVPSEYVSHVVAQLRWLGSPEPEADAAWGTEYVGNGYRAGIPPAAVGDLIYAMHRGFPHRLLRGSNPEHIGGGDEVAYEYVATSSSGRVIFGPTKDYLEAKRHADMAGGVVKYEMPQAKAGEGPHSLHAQPSPATPSPAAKLEPYRKPLRWHRLESGAIARYSAKAGPLGTFVIQRRAPDRRRDVLPWAVGITTAKGPPVPLGQFDRKDQAQKRAAKFARCPIPPAVARETPMAAEVAIVERSPDVRPGGAVLDSPKAVHALLAERYGRLGQEVFEVLLVNLNDELMGAPVQIAMGQASSVHVEPEQVIAVAIAGRAQGAAGFYCAHCHPSGTLRASPSDKDLTRRIEAARKVGCPNMKFLGHIVVTEKGYAQA